MELRKCMQVEIDYRVAVEDREGVAAEKLAQSHQRAAGAQQRRLGRIGYSHAYRVAASERGLNRGGQVIDVDSDVGHAGARQHPERIVNQRTPADFDDRFGHGRR